MRTGAGTLYHQLLTALRERIGSGEIEVGDRLPSEAELERDYGVSRTTARRALDELRRQGVVRREPGRGTFLAGPRVRTDLGRLYSFSEEIERLGHGTGARLVEKGEVGASEEVAGALGVEVGETVLYVRRLRLADELPLFVGDSYLPVERFSLLRDADYEAVSLSRALREAAGLEVERARQWIGAVAAGESVAALLEVEPGSPVLCVERIAFVRGDEPVESVKAYFHPTRYRHYNELSLRHEQV